MKKVILSLALTFSCLNIWANNEFEKKSTDSDFEKVQKIEAFVEANPGTTYNVLINSSPELLQNIELLDQTSAGSMSPVKDMPLLGGFWWGCCLGIVGLALVYFITDNDRDQVKKALVGCLIATLLWSIGGLWNPFSW